MLLLVFIFLVPLSIFLKHKIKLSILQKVFRKFEYSILIRMMYEALTPVALGICIFIMYGGGYASLQILIIFIIVTVSLLILFIWVKVILFG